MKPLVIALILLASMAQAQTRGWKGRDLGEFLRGGSVEVSWKPELGLFPDASARTLAVFFASYCGYCEAEMPRLIRLRDRYGKCGLNVIGIAIEKDVEATRRAARDWKIPFPVVQDRGFVIKRAFDIRKIPTEMFLDPIGRVTDWQVTTVDAGSFYKRIEKEFEKSKCAP